MKITLNLTETEAIYIRDALIDKSIALRTGANEIVRKESEFLDDPNTSKRRKANYFTLRDVVNVLNAHIR